jgi:hypothetical protein
MDDSKYNYDYEGCMRNPLNIITIPNTSKYTSSVKISNKTICIYIHTHTEVMEVQHQARGPNIRS